MKMANENKLELTSKMLMECKKPSEIIELPAVRDRWVNTYNLTTGKQDGELKFEAEKILFVQTVAESQQLAKCTQMSIYSSFILLAVSGLSLRDDQCYLVPYKDKCGFLVGWKGRLEQMSQIPGVKHVNEPICVYEDEDFDYEIKDGVYNIIKHKPSLNTEGKKILAVYATIEYADSIKTHLMKREEVISIRDRYSASYKDYSKIEPNEKGKRMKKYKDKQTGEWKEFELEAPMWVTDEAQAFKKTLIHRMYKSISKSGTQKYLDREIQNFKQTIVEDSDVEQIDEEEISRKINDLSKVEDTTFEEVKPEEQPKEEPKAVEPKEQIVKPVIVADDDTF